MTTILQSLLLFLFVPILANLAQAIGATHSFSTPDTPLPLLESAPTPHQAPPNHHYDPTGALLHQQQSHNQADQTPDLRQTAAPKPFTKKLDAANRATDLIVHPFAAAVFISRRLLVSNFSKQKVL